MNKLEKLRELRGENDRETWWAEERTSGTKSLRFENPPYRRTVLLDRENESKADYIIAMHEALPDLLRVVDLARTIAHEHPDESWGYDGAGIHCYDGEITSGCPFCEALARLEEQAS